MKGVRMKRHEYIGGKYNIDIKEIKEESELEKISFENMVSFYLEELIAIDNGATIEKVLPRGIRQKMRKYGMFSITHQSGYCVYNSCLSQKARILIKKIMDDRKSQ